MKSVFRQTSFENHPHVRAATLCMTQSRHAEGYATQVRTHIRMQAASTPSNSPNLPCPSSTCPQPYHKRAFKPRYPPQYRTIRSIPLILASSTTVVVSTFVRITEFTTYTPDSSGSIQSVHPHLSHHTLMHTVTIHTNVHMGKVDRAELSHS